MWTPPINESAELTQRVLFVNSLLWGRVSFETSFDSKQPKLEPKLVSALSKTKRLFRLFRFYTETESFDVSIEPKQTEDQPKPFKRFGGSCHSFYLFCLLQSHTFIITFVQYTHPFAEASLQFDRKHILLFFTENFWLFRFFRFFGLFRNSLFRLFRFYTKTESFDVSIKPKQTEDPPKQFKREYIWVFLKKFRVVSVCFGLLWNKSVCFGCFDIGLKHRNKPNFLAFGFTKQTEANAKQILFRFVSVRTEIYFCLFRGHPTLRA